MSERQNTRQIALAQLKPGMFVVKLDIPWIDSPFLKHSRMIASGDDIVKLRNAGVKQVVIDLDRGASPAYDKNSKVKKGVQTSAKMPPSSGISEPAAVSLEREMSVALKLRSDIKNTIRDMNDRLEHKLPVNAEQMEPLIDQTLASLERNSQALLNLVHLSGKAQKLVDHAFGTFCLALNLAVTLGLADEEREALGIAALLHETGWLQLPLHLMGKRSPYTQSEKMLVQSHIDIGMKMLAASDIPPLSEQIIIQHHEACDGSGYPKGLAGDSIHRAARILSVADTYDEWVHQLTDKPGMLPTTALRALYKLAEHGRYDVEIVAALINILGVYPVTTAVILNSGEKGVVEEVYAQAHLAPVVRLEYDAEGKALPESRRIDLRTETALSIRAVLDPGNRLDDPDKRLYAQFGDQV